MSPEIRNAAPCRPSDPGGGGSAAFQTSIYAIIHRLDDDHLKIRVGYGLLYGEYDIL